MYYSQFHVQLQFGPMLIGVFLNMILYGTYFYFKTYTSDSIWIRLFVAYLFVLESANTAIDMAMMYQPLIAEYGTEKAVMNFPTQPILIVLISAPIQCFFAWRIQRITQSYWIPCVVVALALASSAGGFITGVKVAILKLFIKKPELHWPALLWLLTSCVADLLITVTLVRSLSQRKTGFVVTDTVVDKIIRCTVQTGMITAVSAIGDVVSFLALPPIHSHRNFLWDITLAKLYANCLMSTLNARATLMSSSQVTPVHRNALDPSMPSESRFRPMDGFSERSRNVIAPQVYELDNTKAFEMSNSDHTEAHRDIERFGIL
ncbi:hypothetical protein BT96DRAFT_920684 [Gymnopus androsaceus JB14]|uniref:DUF6534 domain-containing protein n=1 Tax=Gymnopus androsaceus JB14 TaxID=1447944 RepID=A0A6A4HKS6_9AGAR|nr:hypothetical protein BT96DRAFT_920684 [Gymnopus androsaceus JB14]